MGRAAGQSPRRRSCTGVDDQGGQESTGAAEFLLDEGRQVEIITPHYSVGEDLGPTNKPPVYSRLYAKGAQMQATWELAAIENGYGPPAGICLAVMSRIAKTSTCWCIPMEANR